MKNHSVLFRLLFVSLVVFVLIPTGASAHRSGCHRWHSCPSDTGSYVCGDTGHTSQCSEQKGNRAGDPPIVDEKTYDIMWPSIKTFWEKQGGLPIFGYAKSLVHVDVRSKPSYLYIVFERARLESHSENLPPYNVLIGRLGEEHLRYLGRPWQNEPQGKPTQGCLYFEETKHTLCEPFLSYWQSNGLELDKKPGKSYAESLALFGMPLTEAAVETNMNGDTVLTQWFERARFEYHEGKGVLLGLLGNEYYSLLDGEW
jgi:hypothetical protein